METHQVRVPRFKTILADPPWPEKGAGRIKRGADRHYPVIPVRKMPKVILESGVWRPAPSCHLYMWVTNNYLKDGLWLLEELGFRFIHPITWAKGKAGIGQYRAGQTEHLLFGTQGRAMMPKRKLAASTLLGRRIVDHERDGRGKIIHSAKPICVYGEIEVVSPGPRLEMFSRYPQPGWWAWGNLGQGRNPLEPVFLKCDKRGQIERLEI